MSTWVKVCETDDVENEDVIAVTLEGRPLAVYRSPEDEYYVTDGLCTHEKVLLATGLVMDHEIECPKHNGRFDYRTGAGLSAPICENLRTYPVKVVGTDVLVNLGG